MSPCSLLISIILSRVQPVPPSPLGAPPCVPPSSTSLSRCLVVYVVVSPSAHSTESHLNMDPWLKPSSPESKTLAPSVATSLPQVPPKCPQL